MNIELLPMLLNLFAAVVLIAVLFMLPRKKQPLFRIDEVRFHDRVNVFYPMKRTMFGWRVIVLERGVRGYRLYEEAQQALETYLSDNLGMEISETRTLKEYG